MTSKIDPNHHKGWVVDLPSHAEAASPGLNAPRGTTTATTFDVVNGVPYYNQLPRPANLGEVAGVAAGTSFMIVVMLWLLSTMIRELTAVTLSDSNSTTGGGILGTSSLFIDLNDFDDDGGGYACGDSIRTQRRRRHDEESLGSLSLDQYNNDRPSSGSNNRPATAEVAPLSSWCNFVRITSRDLADVVRSEVGGLGRLVRQRKKSSCYSASNGDPDLDNYYNDDSNTHHRRTGNDPHVLECGLGGATGRGGRSCSFSLSSSSSSSPAYSAGWASSEVLEHIRTALPGGFGVGEDKNKTDFLSRDRSFP